MGEFFGEERDGTIECLYYEHMITSPRDPNTSAASGNMRNTPVVLRKQVDSTSPLFANAYSLNEMFESVVFKFVPTSNTAGSPPAIFMVKLSRATVSSFKQIFAETPSARYVGVQLLEEIGFYYQKIEWGFNEHLTAAIDWPIGQ